jgi:hypothetical protein
MVDQLDEHGASRLVFVRGTHAAQDEFNGWVQECHEEQEYVFIAVSNLELAELLLEVSDRDRLIDTLLDSVLDREEHADEVAAGSESIQLRGFLSIVEHISELAQAFNIQVNGLMELRAVPFLDNGKFDHRVPECRDAREQAAATIPPHRATRRHRLDRCLPHSQEAEE